LREYVEKPITRIEEVEHTITCNRCGKSYTYTGDAGTDMVNYQQFYNYSTRFQYGSRLEGQIWEFDLCENCLREIVKGFKIAPKIENISEFL
jgi:ribosomal protein S14